MKGMEGYANENKDGKITLGEMQAYLVEHVGKEAGMMNRKQEPQLVGDANRVLVGRKTIFLRERNDDDEKNYFCSCNNGTSSRSQRWEYQAR
jgi:hypothetical protein